MSQRVPSRGGRKSRGRMILVILAALLAGTAFAVPAASFTSANTPRDVAVDVVKDSGGVVELDKAQTVQKNSEDRLVTVTNNFDTDREFRVSLVENDGDLYYDTDGDGTRENVGTSVTFMLTPGTSTDVYVEATGRANSLLEYDVTDTLVSGDAGVRFSLRRSAEIQGGNGNGAPGNSGNNSQA